MLVVQYPRAHRERLSLVMVLIFLGLIAVHGLSAFYIAWKNNFSFNLLSVLLPTAGSVLLSAYLAFSTFFVEAPEPKKFQSSVMLLRDLRTGAFSSLYAPRIGNRIERLNYFQGLRDIEFLKLEDRIKQLKLEDVFRKHEDQKADELANEALLDLLEFGFLRWLATSGNWVYGESDGEIIGLQSGMPRVYTHRMVDLRAVKVASRV